MSKGLVLVSGVTGYIGSWVCQEFLDNGYSVRGTVRNLEKKKGKEHLQELIDKGNPLELVQADLLDDASWEAACDGVDYVAHVASPFQIAVKAKEAEEKLYKPAKHGTLAVLEAAFKCNVKKVVLTSSIAAITGGHHNKHDFDGVDPEEVWTDVNMKNIDPYKVSKTIAEKAAWDFVEQKRNAGEEVFELVTINPALVLGPPLSKGDATSHDYPRKLINRQIPLIPDVAQQTVDVRDVAKAHRLGLELEQANGKRFLCVGSTQTHFKDWSKILRKNFKKYGYYFPTMSAPHFAVKALAKVDRQVGAIVHDLGMDPIPMSTDRIKNTLGMEFIEEEKTIVDHFIGCVRIGTKGFPMTKKFRAAIAADTENRFLQELYK